MGQRVYKALYWAVVAILLLMPTLMLAAGEEENTNSEATLENQLRSNEKVGSKTDDEVVAREEERINPDGLSIAELKILENRAVKHAFQVKYLLDIAYYFLQMTKTNAIS